MGLLTPALLPGVSSTYAQKSSSGVGEVIPAAEHALLDPGQVVSGPSWRGRFSQRTGSLFSDVWRHLTCSAALDENVLNLPIIDPKPEPRGTDVGCQPALPD